jgi:aerobic C4-dicarboxylate transport protein
VQKFAADRDRQKASFETVISHSHALFAVVSIIMKVTIGKYGVVTLVSLAHLMAAFYLTCVIFTVLVLGGVACLGWRGLSWAAWLAKAGIDSQA